MRYVAANPSSFLYLRPERPFFAQDAAGFGVPYGADTAARTAFLGAPSCPDTYDRYRYGLQQLNVYASRAGAAQIKAQYALRDVLYLTGQYDTLDLDCAAADAPRKCREMLDKNGADLDLFHPEATPAPLRARLRIPADALLVLFCGTIGMAHDVGLLARAAAILPADLPAHFVIVGDGAGREALAAEIAALGVGDRVHLLPAVPRHQVPGLLAAADLSAIVLRDSPTFAGVLPSKIFEAMAMRTPILLGVRGEARALVERAGAGLAFEPGDPHALVATLRTFAMLGAPGRQAMGDAARAHALTHHDRIRQAQQLAVFLERLCGPAGRR